MVIRKPPPSETKTAQSQHYLAAPNLPTILTKLAQRIWDMDFIEMEEILPSSKTMQLLESAQGATDPTSSVAAQQQGRSVRYIYVD